MFDLGKTLEQGKRVAMVVLGLLILVVCTNDR
jgi:hypothetical protein